MTHETFYCISWELMNEGLVRFIGQTAEILDRDRLAELME